MTLWLSAVLPTPVLIYFCMQLCRQTMKQSQRELKERAAAIQAQEATVNAEKFMNVVRRHTSFEELTPTLLREFAEKIVVHEYSYDKNKTDRTL